MRGYALSDVFTPRDVAAYDVARVLVDSWPSDSFVGANGAPRPIRCHELARAVFAALGPLRDGLRSCEVVDGQFGIVEHSWIEWGAPQRGSTASVILDVYSVGRAPMVQLVDVSWKLPHRRFYTRETPREDVDQDIVIALLRRFYEASATKLRLVE